MPSVRLKPRTDLALHLLLSLAADTVHTLAHATQKKQKQHAAANKSPNNTMRNTQISLEDAPRDDSGCGMPVSIVLDLHARHPSSAQHQTDAGGARDFGGGRVDPVNEV